MQNARLIRQQTRVRKFHVGRALRPKGDPLGDVAESKVREVATLLQHTDMNQSCSHQVAERDS